MTYTRAGAWLHLRDALWGMVLSDASDAEIRLRDGVYICSVHRPDNSLRWSGTAQTLDEAMTACDERLRADDPRDGPVRLPVPPPLTPAGRPSVPQFVRELPPFPHAEPMSAWNVHLVNEGDVIVTYAAHPRHALIECRGDATEWSVVEFHTTRPGFDANGAPCEEFDA